MYKLKEINFESNIKLKISRNNIPAYSTVIRCDENLLNWIYEYEFPDIPTEQDIRKVISQFTTDYASVIPYVYSIDDKKPFIKCDIDNSIIHFDNYTEAGFNWDKTDDTSINIDLFNYEFIKVEDEGIENTNGGEC